MSKFDGEIRAAAEASVELDQLLVAFARSPLAPADRHDALAQYLSGDEGWRDASKALRGAFATASAGGRGLTGDKDT